MASIDVPAVSSNGHRELEPAFETDTAEIIHLDVEVDTPFRVDRTRRQITGLLVPWGAIGQSGFERWRFARGSLKFGDVGRVKLLRDHDMGRAVGRAVELTDREDGLHGTFSVARGDAGDEVLSLAEDGVLDGFSIGPRIPASGWEIDRNDRDVRLVHSARLVEVTVTAIPAMDDARVKSVTMQQGGSQMGDTKVKPGTDPGGTGTTVLDGPDAGMEKFQADLDARFKAMLDKQAESNKVQAEQVAGTIAAAFDSAFTRLQGSDAAGLGAAAAARFKVIKEPPVYRFDGDIMKPSLVKDAWLYHRNGDFDARDRLRKFQEQQGDIVKFTQVNTTSASDVVPPGYRPDLFVTELMQGRPIVAQSSRGTITDATPFTVPRFVSTTDATQDHVEGTNPSIGTIVLDSTVVSPGAISGIFELTREIVDSSNPAIDAIALAAMRESWNQQTETKAYAALNGAAAVTHQFTAIEAAVDANWVDTSRDLLARYPFTRFAAPNGAVMGQRATRAMANAKDSSGRALLPSIGAQNAVGVGNAVQQGWFVDGLPFVPAWAIPDTPALTDELIISNRADWWTWESPLLTFRFEEKRGPAIIELALFGYYATHVLRNAGIFAIEVAA